MNNRRSNIAANIRHLRKANRMSQEEVAEKIGVSRQAVAKWENGDYFPISSTAKPWRICMMCP